MKLEEFIKCPAGQIVKYKLNNNKKNLSVCFMNRGTKISCEYKSFEDLLNTCNNTTKFFSGRYLLLL